MTKESDDQISRVSFNMRFRNRGFQHDPTLEYKRTPEEEAIKNRLDQSLLSGVELTEREKLFLSAWLEGLGYETISDYYAKGSLTRERVRQIVKGAISKISKEG